MTPGSPWAWAGRALLSLETPGEKTGKIGTLCMALGHFTEVGWLQGYSCSRCIESREEMVTFMPLLALGTLSDAKNVSLFRVTLEDPKVGGLWPS